MSVKIKITVDPSEPKPEGYIYRHETFFIKVSDSTWASVVQIAAAEGTTVDEAFVNIIKGGLDRVKRGGTL